MPGTYAQMTELNRNIQQSILSNTKVLGGVVMLESGSMCGANILTEVPSTVNWAMLAVAGLAAAGAVMNMMVAAEITYTNSDGTHKPGTPTTT